MSSVVADVLDLLESVALDLFPAWLPAAEVIGTSSELDVRVMRDVARRHATSSAHFGPFLADLAAGETGQRRTAAALEWLANQGRVGTCLTADALPLVDRYPTWHLAVPAHVEALVSDEVPGQPTPVDYPALEGIPHPASAVEQTLERRLARCHWAAC